MVQRPDTKYVEVGEADVAYQVIGDGPNDVLYFYGLGSHVEVQWMMADFARFIERLLPFSRVIVFDRRGTGASDGIVRSALPTCEEWTEDVLAVLDAAGSAQTAIIATLDAGQVALLFAAQHPERVSALLFLNATARYARADDYPIGATPEEVDVVIDFLRSTWGTLDFVRAINPDRTGDIGEMQEVAVWARYAVTPRTAAAQYRYFLEHVDVRHALPLIQAPTRVVHVADSFFLPCRPRSLSRGAHRRCDVCRDPGRQPRAHRQPRHRRRRDRRAPDRPAPTHRGRSHPHDGVVHRHRRVHAAGRRDGRPRLARPPR